MISTPTYITGTGILSMVSTMFSQPVGLYEGQTITIAIFTGMLLALVVVGAVLRLVVGKRR